MDRNFPRNLLHVRYDMYQLHIDVLSGPPGTQLTFYGPPPLRVAVDSLDVGEGEVEWSSGAADSVQSLLGASAVSQRGGLWLARELSLPMTLTSANKTVADIAISGLQGWVAVSISPLADGQRRHFSSKEEYLQMHMQDIKLRLWAPKGIEVYVRPPIPTASVVKERNVKRDIGGNRQQRRRASKTGAAGDGEFFDFDFDDGDGLIVSDAFSGDDEDGFGDISASDFEKMLTDDERNQKMPPRV